VTGKPCMEEVARRGVIERRERKNKKIKKL